MNISQREGRMFRALALLIAGSYAIAGAAAAPAVRTSVAKLPIAFERNLGQTDPRVDFLARGRGYTLFLTRSEAVLRAPAGTVRLAWEGASPDAEPVADGAASSVSNYFVGARDRWRTGVERHERVRYRNLYPGVDAVFYGRDGELEYDLVVAAGADVSPVRFRITGADSLRVDDGGDLRIALPGGVMVQHVPAIYQERGGRRSRVAGRYRVVGNEVRFAVAAYDHARPLVIDPVLTYSTYLGGSGSDAAAAIAVDSAGNAYITGTTLSADFPTQGGASGSDAYSYAFVAKIAPAGDRLVYSTYIGGTRETQGRSIAVDSGYVYLTGMTRAPDFPTRNAIKSTLSGVSDSYVIKMTLAGDSITYATLLGGSDDDQTRAITVDGDGSAYVCGRTVSEDFPVPNGAQRVYGGNIGDAFVAKLTAAGSLAWGTYLGGNGDDDCTAIALDPGRNVYVAGATTSANFPSAPYQNGGAFSAKLAADGSRVAYSLVYGPAFSKAYGIAADAAGNAYVVGRTPTRWLTTSGSFQTTYGGGNYDAFAIKVNAAGNALLYSTYLGGKGEDAAYALAVDAAGNAYVAGDTSSTDFPTASALSSSLSGGSDVFVTKLSPTGASLSYSTLLGGSGGDTAFGIALDSAGAAYIAGSTTSLDFPTVRPIQARLGGYSDVLVAKIDPSGGGSGTQCVYSISPETYNPPAAGGSVVVTVSAPAGCSWSIGSAPSWATVTGSGGVGNGSVTVQVAANTGPARTGTATIANNTLTIAQLAGDAGTAVGTLLVSGTPSAFALPSVTATTLFHGDYSYRIDVPQNATQLVIDLTSAQAVNLSLYVRYGSDVALSSGSVAADYSATGSGAAKRITITPSSSPALRAGTYYIGILVGSTGVGISGSVTATLAVPCSYSISPGTATAAASGGSGSVTVATTSGCSWQASPAASWLSVSPSSGVGGASVTWTATANTAASSRTGTIAIAGQTLTVTQAAAAQASNDLTPGAPVEWIFPSVSNASLFHGDYSYRVTVGSSVTQVEFFLALATAGASVDMYVRYGNDVALSNGVVVADYSVKGGGTTKRLVIDRASNPALRAGVYYVAFVVNTTGAAIRASLVSNAGTGSQAPVVTDGGVVGAASFVSSGVVPGSPFTIFGDALAPVEAGAASVPLPTKLGGVQVRVNGVLAPLFYAGPKQINAQLPYETAPGDAELVVLVNGMVSGSAKFQVYPAGPGIIQYSAGNRLRAVAVNQDGAINGTTAAAARGSVVTVYLVGCGPVKAGQPLVTGAATPMELRWLELPYSVTIGDVAAVVDYIGLTPGAVGLYQMNVRIPQGLAAGDYPIVLQVGSSASNAPYIAVK